MNDARNASNQRGCTGLGLSTGRSDSGFPPLAYGTHRRIVGRRVTGLHRLCAGGARAFVADIAGEDTRGASYGIYTFAYFLGAAIGPLAGGWLYDNLGHAMPFYLNTAVLLAGAALVAGVLREPRATE